MDVTSLLNDQTGPALDPAFVSSPQTILSRGISLPVSQGSGAGPLPRITTSSPRAWGTVSPTNVSGNTSAGRSDTLSHFKLASAADNASQPPHRSKSDSPRISEDHHSQYLRERMISTRLDSYRLRSPDVPSPPDETLGSRSSISSLFSTTSQPYSRLSSITTASGPSNTNALTTTDIGASRRESERRWLLRQGIEPESPDRVSSGTTHQQHGRIGPLRRRSSPSDQMPISQDHVVADSSSAAHSASHKRTSSAPVSASHLGPRLSGQTHLTQAGDHSHTEQTAMSGRQLRASSAKEREIGSSLRNTIAGLQGIKDTSTNDENAISGQSSPHSSFLSDRGTTRSPIMTAPTARTSDPSGDSALKCMFVENCNTGSNQLRKAISHFFGRNKSCTKLVPKEVWIYFCRKHYQRCRYRNAKTYPENQIGYVITQIERIKDWDETSGREGGDSRIGHWCFALRKREKNRIQGDNADPDDDEAGMSDVTPPPQWVLDAVNHKYTTDEIMAYAKRLQVEICDGTLGGIPEVEFLPMISGPGQHEPEKSVAKRARKPSQSQRSVSGAKRKAVDAPAVIDTSQVDLKPQASEEVPHMAQHADKRRRLAGPNEPPMPGASQLSGSDFRTQPADYAPMMRPFDAHTNHAGLIQAGTAMKMHASPQQPRIDYTAPTSVSSHPTVSHDFSTAQAINGHARQAFSHSGYQAAPPHQQKIRGFSPINNVSESTSNAYSSRELSPMPHFRVPGGLETQRMYHEDPRARRPELHMLRQPAMAMQLHNSQGGIHHRGQPSNFPAVSLPPITSPPAYQHHRYDAFPSTMATPQLLPALTPSARQPNTTGEGGHWHQPSIPPKVASKAQDLAR